MRGGGGFTFRLFWSFPVSGEVHTLILRSMNYYDTILNLRDASNHIITGDWNGHVRPNGGSVTLWIYPNVQTNYGMKCRYKIFSRNSNNAVHTRPRGYPCENQTQNTGKHAILPVVSPQHNEETPNMIIPRISGKLCAKYKKPHTRYDKRNTHM